MKERMVVVGDDERDLATGSVAVIDDELLERQEFNDIHRILTYAPGVNFQEEDGFGLRPNIGFRGSGVERSGNITLLEDGVLIAPAPYSAPSAYYFPTAGRIERVEIRKGSSSIRQGPYTNGGTLNLVSTSIPDDFLAADVTAFGGNNDTFQGHANVGGEVGNFGWLVETFQNETAGFKDLPNGGDTGFELNDYLGKFRWQSSPDANMFQRVEFKIGRTEQEANETYLGLTASDFNGGAFERYAASAEDRIVSDHDQYQVRYFIQPNELFDVTATAYRNEFFRNWRKLERAGGTSVATILANPDDFAAELGWLRGDIDSPDGALDVRNNRRDYVSQGVDVRVHGAARVPRGGAPRDRDRHALPRGRRGSLSGRRHLCHHERRVVSLRSRRSGQSKRTASNRPRLSPRSSRTRSRSGASS